MDTAGNQRTRAAATRCTATAFAVCFVTVVANLQSCSTREFNSSTDGAGNVSSGPGFAYGEEGKDPAYERYEKKKSGKAPTGF